MARPPRLWILATVVASATFVGSYCDVRPDVCETEGESSCTPANEIRVCSRAGAEARLDWELIPCGATRTCMLDTSSKAFCARAPLSPCSDPSAASCSDAGTLTRCKSVPDAGQVFGDSVCESAASCESLRTTSFDCPR